MAWVDIVVSRTDVDSPVTQDLFGDIVGNFTGLANGDGTAPKVQTAAIADNAVTLAKMATGSVDTDEILSGAIHQAEMDTSIATQTTTVGADAIGSITLTGGGWGWHTAAGEGTPSGDNGWYLSVHASGASLSRIAYFNSLATSEDLVVHERYINASAPYDLGDGQVPFFAFLWLSGSDITASSFADTPPWIYNGPTNVTGKRAADGRYGRYMTPFEADMRSKGRRLRDELLDPKKQNALIKMELKGAKTEFVEIKPSDKNADMGIIPHPFTKASGAPVLIDPMSPEMELLAMLQAEGDDLHDIVKNHLVISNSAIQREAPPGVTPIALRWKNTGRL